MYPIANSHVAAWEHIQRKIYLLDIINGIIVQTINGKVGEVPPLYRRTWEHLGDFKFLAFSENDEDIKLWDLKTGKLLHTYKTGWNRKLTNMVVSGDKSIMICTYQADNGDGNAEALVFDLKKKQQLALLKREGIQDELEPRSCAVSYDGGLLFHSDSVRISCLQNIQCVLKKANYKKLKFVMFCNCLLQ